jgi:beta-lactamase regulating signal transducer with metallopeptidase domain
VIDTMAGALPATPALAIVLALLAIVLGIARCGWQTISLHRKLARCRLIQGGPARTVLDELLRTVPRAPEVLLLSAPDDSEPAAFGIARWTIVLPPRAAFDLTEDELRALLAHELAHLVRGDSLWLCISRTLCSCLAFQPLNHLARREWQRTAEFLCDNWAVNRTGAPLALARCLTEVASWQLTGPASAAILAATGRKSGLVDRIERLLDARPACESRNELRDRRRTALTGAVVLAILACCAPRVQLVAAGNVAREHFVADSNRRDQFEARANEQESGDVHDTDAAKLQARGERQSRDEELPDEALQEPSANAAQRPAGDQKSLFEALDDDLMALVSELESLGPLLNENASPQAVALAGRLRGEIVRLQHRREMLKTSWRKSKK